MKKKFNNKTISFVALDEESDDLIGAVELLNQDKLKITPSEDKPVKYEDTLDTDQKAISNADIFDKYENLKSEIKIVPIFMLQPAPDDWNFFKPLSAERLAALAESIYAQGLLQPIVVRELDEEGTELQILAGHNRVKAFVALQKALPLEKENYASIEAKVFKYGMISDKQAQEIVVDTNFVQRGNLSARDKAICIFRKAQILSVEQNAESKYSKGRYNIAQKVADEFKLKRTAFYRYMEISKIYYEYEELINEGRISLKAAEIIASYPQDIQIELIHNHRELLTTRRIARLTKKTPYDEIIPTLAHVDDELNSFKYILEANILPHHDETPLLFYVKRDDYQDIINDIASLIASRKSIKNVPIVIKPQRRT